MWIFFVTPLIKRRNCILELLLYVKHNLYNILKLIIQMNNGINSEYHVLQRPSIMIYTS